MPNLSTPLIGSMTKRSRQPEPVNPFPYLPEEILFRILDLLDPHPLDKKSLSLVSRTFHSLESRHRRRVTPLRRAFIPTILSRYPNATTLSLSLCPIVTDGDLTNLPASLLSVDLSQSRSFSLIGLENLMASCVNLTELDLSNRTEMGDREATEIGRGAKNLRVLKMARWKGVTDLGVGCIAVGCSKLRVLVLRWCVGVTDLAVGLLAIKCRELKTLDLSFLPITKECLPPILKLPYLEDLCLMGCLGLDDDRVFRFQQEWRSLEVLNMSNCEHVSETGLTSILKGATGLQQLILAYYSPVTPSLASSLQKLGKLRSLRLDGCEITNAGLNVIGSSCISLKELSLRKCIGVTDEGVSYVVAKHRELVKLDITCCRMITDVSLASITRSCSSLTSLRMESCGLVSKDAFVLIGQRCPLLEELDLTDTEIDNEGLKAISGCHNLSSLKIGICLNINDEGLIHVGNCCPKLYELDLYRSVGITDASIAAIAHGCPMLQMINLSYCAKVTDNALKSLSECSLLNTLEIRGCSQVSSAGLYAIALGCQQIAKLDIKKCNNINDAGMLPLARFSQNLRQINLSYCSVTDVGLLSLASISCLQNMTILHVRGLSPHGLATALLSCGGLTKVKLHSSFKTLISKPFFEHLEARGCMFQWRDKPYQLEVDSVEVWKQQSREVLAV